MVTIQPPSRTRCFLPTFLCELGIAIATGATEALVSWLLHM
ncbi:hypothetical protein ACFT38_28630 [Streptomyces sp. NPDC056975]